MIASREGDDVIISDNIAHALGDFSGGWRVRFHSIRPNITFHVDTPQPEDAVAIAFRCAGGTGEPSGHEFQAR